MIKPTRAINTPAISSLRSRERLAQKEETGICLGAPFRVVLGRLPTDFRREAVTLLILPPVLLEREVRLPERALDVLREGAFVFFLWAISVRFWELRMGSGAAHFPEVPMERSGLFSRRAYHRGCRRIIAQMVCIARRRRACLQESSWLEISMFFSDRLG